MPLLSSANSLAITYYKQLLKPHQTLIIPHELLGYEKNEFWFNLAGKGQETLVHNHNEKAIVSGVYYLKVPNHSGNIFFRSHQKKILEIKAKKGKMILFPSELDHFVPQNKSNDNRISISFNCYKFPMTHYIDNSEY